MSFEKIGFIGFGLIGGSIAKKARINDPNIKIYATARREETVRTAYSMGLIDNSEPMKTEDFADMDYIFLCAPVEHNIEYLRKLAGIISPKTIITDVGSTKSQIHAEAERLGIEKNFIGGHPMTGSEKTGVENASEYLLENAYYIITPTKNGNEEITEEFTGFVRSLGSIPLILDYDDHDHATASISHLPHMISYALTNLVRKIDDEEETMKTIAAGGFRDMTRIAASSPVMWENICVSNKKYLLELMDLYIEEFVKLRENVENSMSKELLEYFGEAKEYRDSLAVPSRKLQKMVYEIFVDLADETGGIAVIASLLAFKGVSIKNIGIINNREFQQGVLRIEFYDKESLDKAYTTLSERNYKIYRR